MLRGKERGRKIGKEGKGMRGGDGRGNGWSIFVPNGSEGEGKEGGRKRGEGR
jgi:hypothetical protein